MKVLLTLSLVFASVNLEASTCRLNLLKAPESPYTFKLMDEEDVLRKIEKKGYEVTLMNKGEWRRSTGLKALLSYEKVKSDLLYGDQGIHLRYTKCKAGIKVTREKDNGEREVIFWKTKKQRSLTSKRAYQRCKRAERRVISSLPKCKDLFAQEHTP